ncbi:FtsW/RodA/SpoVE family cell cycle protein, partial [Bacillus velezensis]|uniref:FtsW/RodA/SpoVE family cell cycle protein n=1 Tax=Bacillus velezensis TaxID=492670 RepID=UPI002FFEEE45
MSSINVIQRRYFDVKIILLVILLSIISCAFVYSASNSGQYKENFVEKQIIFYVIGFILMFISTTFDSEQLKKLSWISYVVIFASIIFLLFAPESIARRINGAKAWYQLPLIGSFQPSEYMKICFILVVSNIIDKHNKKHQEHTLRLDLLLIGKIAIVVVPPSVFVLRQPDTGMIMLYFAIIVPMIYMSGINKILASLITVLPISIISTIVFIYFRFNEFFINNILGLLMPHQRQRIFGWLDPFQYTDEGYQTKQGILAIGSGQLRGKGWGQGHVYIPEKHTDFIFAAIGEDTGFIGCSIVIGIFFVLIYRIVTIALSSSEHFGLLV